MYGLANMLLFLVMVNYIAALVAVQLLRGDLGEDTPLNFGELFNAFLGVYQVFSSENWTDVLYSTTGAEIRLGQTVIVALFISAWMLFANCEIEFSFNVHQLTIRPHQSLFCRCLLLSSTRISTLRRNLKKGNKPPNIGPLTKLRRGQHPGSVN
jgi:hypothetical protein